MKIDLTEVLRVERLDNNLFRSLNHCENYRQFLYGGQVLSQALKACTHTVEERLPHSLHAYFLRAGDNRHPVIYDVENARDGGSFSSRRCVARQYGQPILNLSASFHKAEEGFEHQIAFPENVPFPDELLSQPRQSLFNMKDTQVDLATPFEILPFTTTESALNIPEDSFWIRCREKLSDDPMEHYCALAFASDLGLIATSIKPHHPPIFDENIIAASIDHAMWFHKREFRVDEWMLYHNESPWAGNARSFARAHIYDTDKKLIASTAQEGLVRQI